MDAGFEGLHVGCGFACVRGGAGGLLGVMAVGFYLFDGGHMDKFGRGCLSYFEDKREDSLFRR